MVLNCFMAASVLAIVKYSSPDFSLGTLLSSYHFIATILTVVVIIYMGGGFKSNILHLHFLRSLCSTLAYFLYFHALSITSMANVIALGYTDAILTCLFSYLFLKEPLGRAQIINLVLSLIGAFLIIRPDIHIFNTGALLAGISAILWAISNVMIKIIGKIDKEHVQLFYSNLFMFLLAGMVAIWEGKIFEGSGDSFSHIFTHCHWIILLAVFSSIQAFALFKSLMLATTGVVMPFFIVSVLFVHFYGYMFFGETQTILEIFGTLLIIIVGVVQILKLY